MKNKLRKGAISRRNFGMPRGFGRCMGPARQQPRLAEHELSIYSIEVLARFDELDCCARSRPIASTDSMRLPSGFTISSGAIIATGSSKPLKPRFSEMTRRARNPSWRLWILFCLVFCGCFIHSCRISRKNYGLCSDSAQGDHGIKEPSIQFAPLPGPVFPSLDVVNSRREGSCGEGL